MKIGVPKEIKSQEYRVGMTPAGVRELVELGHEIIVQHQAGNGAGFTDEEYVSAGASIEHDVARLFQQCRLIVKVKEPLEEEFDYLKGDHILFTYLHLAAEPQLADELIRKGTASIAYETVADPNGNLPLLAPMSEVAGRLSLQAAARCLEKSQGGSGILLGGVPGVAPGRVLVLGGGVVGFNAARLAVGLGAQVSVVDKSPVRLKAIDEFFSGRVVTLYSNTDTIEKAVADADVVIGAVLIPGGSAPKLVNRAMLQRMRPGSVLVDVAIDQGGCFETSRPTTHQNPTFVLDNIVHYCVSNMPGAVARTSTQALTNSTLPYIIKLANQGLAALLQDPALCQGLNTLKGHITHAAVAQSLGKTYEDPTALLSSP